MVEICHLENHEITRFQRKIIIDFDEIWYTNADLELSDSHMNKYENL